MKVTKCAGETQSSCKRCLEKKKWNSIRACFLYKIEGYEGCCCADCVKEITEGEHDYWKSLTTATYIGTDECGEPKWADRKFFVHRRCGRKTVIKENFCPTCGVKMDLEEPWI